MEEIMHSPVANFIEARYSGLIHPLVGIVQPWHLAREGSPIYLDMLAEGWPNPFLDHDSVARGALVPGLLVTVTS
jgi:hypothetical protein